MKLKLLLVFSIITVYCNAQIAGTIDTNFGALGTASFTGQSDLFPYNINYETYTGEIAAVGQYTNAGGITVGFIARFDFYGNPKTGFGNNGVLEISDLSTTSQSLYDGVFVAPGSSALIVKGSYRDASNTFVPFFRKYHADGTLDTSYGVNGTITGIFGEIHGNYIYSIGTNTATQHQYFKRYNLADGTLDPTFNNGDFPFDSSSGSYNVSSQYNTINFQADGKIVLCGTVTLSGIDYTFVGRYDSLGNIDTTFGINGYYLGSQNTGAWMTATQSDGKIVCLLNSYAAAGTQGILSRINSNGTLDTSYGVGGFANRTFAYSQNFLDKLSIQSDNKVLICGSEKVATPTSTKLFLGRYTATGTEDFWRSDLESRYSENWSMTQISNTYGLTFGQTSTNDFSIFTPQIQRIYLKEPVLSLYTTNNATDLNMTTTNHTQYTLTNVPLAAGAVKFRMDHDWTTNWGAALSNPFPTGVATMGQGDITIPTSGNYDVSLNLATGVYSFTQVLGTQQHTFVKPVIHPNPVSAILTLESNTILDKIAITSIEGKKIKEVFNTNQVDVSDLAAGLYVIRAMQSGQAFSEKFIKK